MDGDNHSYVMQVPGWPNPARLWERYQEAPEVLRMVVAQLLDRDNIARFSEENLQADAKIDITVHVDKGRTVLRPAIMKR